MNQNSSFRPLNFDGFRNNLLLSNLTDPTMFSNQISLKLIDSVNDLEFGLSKFVSNLFFEISSMKHYVKTYDERH